MANSSLTHEVPIPAAPTELSSADAGNVCLLDNPIWNALRTDHSTLSWGDEHARRYPSEIGPLSGIPEETPVCYQALRTIAGERDIVVLFSERPIDPGPGWTIVSANQLYQMVYTQPARRPSLPGAGGLELRQLTPADTPAMLALAELTEPGPFRVRTIDLGNFYGTFQRGELVAMAGKRLHLPGYVEVSGVCTHPDARGRGYAALLMSMVMDEILSEGKTPFLHVLTTNPAVRLYEKLGFAIRKAFHWAVLRPES